MSEWTSIRDAADVTDEIAEIAYELCDGFYQDTRVDWGDVWDRMDGAELADGTLLDMGEDLSSPAIREIKRRVNKARK